MNAPKLVTILIVMVSFVLLFAVSVSAQEVKTVTVAGILEKAKCPLTEEQAKKLKEFKPGGDRSGFRAVYELFDEKQTTALKEALGSSPGRNGGPERPRNLFFTVIFENSGCPFTEDQITKMKELPTGKEGFEKMREVFTEKQNAIMDEMFNR